MTKNVISEMQPLQHPTPKQSKQLMGLVSSYLKLKKNPSMLKAYYKNAEQGTMDVSDLKKVQDAATGSLYFGFDTYQEAEQVKNLLKTKCGFTDVRTSGEGWKNSSYECSVYLSKESDLDKLIQTMTEKTDKLLSKKLDKTLEYIAKHSRSGTLKERAADQLREKADELAFKKETVGTFTARYNERLTNEMADYATKKFQK